MENTSNSFYNVQPCSCQQHGMRMCSDLSHDSRCTGVIAPNLGSDQKAQASAKPNRRTSVANSASRVHRTQPRGLTGRDTGHGPIPLQRSAASAAVLPTPHRKPGRWPSDLEAALAQYLPQSWTTATRTGQYNPATAHQYNPAKADQYNPLPSNLQRVKESRPILTNAALREAKLTVRARGNLAHGNNHMPHTKYTLYEL
jgi:hypothetical protein